jgi:hypothetical protein
VFYKSLHPNSRTNPFLPQPINLSLLLESALWILLYCPVLHCELPTHDLRLTK